jgi:hypothetical protein
LSKEDKKKNRELSKIRVLVANVIALIKRFKIIADKYRNRRKRFALRFNLIAAICNWEINCALFLLTQILYRKKATTYAKLSFGFYYFFLHKA